MNKSTRDLKQEECVKAWVNNKCKATVVGATGFGKSRVATIAIKLFLEKNPGKKIIIIVPTQQLQEQWINNLTLAGFMFIDVLIVNSAIKNKHSCDLLIIDEIHLMASNTFRTIFEVIKYKLILGLTATFERLDGQEIILEKYCPPCIEVPLEECLKNGWVAPYKEYRVLIDVDLTEYNKHNQEFFNHFSFFNHDFNKAMSCTGAKGYLGRENYLREICTDKDKFPEMRKIILAHTFGFTRSLQERKNFINNHPKKIEITNLILEYRQDKKVVTFSPTIKIAEKIKYGYVLHSGQTKKKRGLTLEEFDKMNNGVLNTSKAVNQGSDIAGLNLGIWLGINSSKTTKIQQLGRIIRFSPDKTAEAFTLIIKGTVEEKWFSNSNPNFSGETIEEDQLLNLLQGKEYYKKKNKESNMLFRF